MASKARERADVFPLHVGDTYLEPIECARAEAQRTETYPHLHTYAPVQGQPELLEAAAAHIRRRGECLIDQDDIQVVSGATAGLSVVSEALLSAGDEVLLPSPYWPLIRGIIAKRGAHPVEVPFMDAPNSHDLEAKLEAALTERTVAIYLNTPHNPTGNLLDDGALAAVARVAERHNLWVFSDEVYEEIYFGSLPPTPIWARADFQRRTVAVHSLSKAYGLAGSRIGWVHGPSEAMRAVRAVQTFSTYCAAKPMQIAGARALREGGQWLAAARSAYRTAAEMAAEALGVPAPAGGTFLFVPVGQLLRQGETTIDFLERCLDRGVLLTPGISCGRDYESWVRVCFTAIAPDRLERALDQLRPLFTA